MSAILVTMTADENRSSKVVSCFIEIDFADIAHAGVLSKLPEYIYQFLSVPVI
jgi:hypothetical protein